MNYGLHLSAAGALTSMHQQDVHANNLANIQTVGFKPDMAITRDRLPHRVDGAFQPVDPKLMLENLGGGHLLDVSRINLSQGNLESTGNALDLAISGDGFFAISDGPGAENLRLTRDGRMTLAADGTLVMAATGKPILDVNNQPIRLNPALDVQIDASGEISQNGRVVARMQIVEPNDPALLQKVGNSLMRLDPQNPAALVPATGSVVQGHIESSAVDPIMTMNAMIGASKAVASNAAMMQYHDHIMDQAINTFGRVA
jgi:flagellar basal-body rod protein FlgF